MVGYNLSKDLYLKENNYFWGRDVQLFVFLWIFNVY